MAEKTLAELIAENEDRTVEEVKELFAAAVAENNAAILEKIEAVEDAREEYLDAYTDLVKERNTALLLRNQYRALLPAGSYDPADSRDYSPLNDVEIKAVPDYALDYHFTGAIDKYYELKRETTITDPMLLAILDVISTGVYTAKVEEL